MDKKDIIIIADYTEATPLRLDELCEICGINSVIIQGLVEYEIIQPQGNSPEEWEFELVQVKRLQTALRLQRELEVNLPGVAVVLDLLDEMEEMRARLELLEKHFSKL